MSSPVVGPPRAAHALSRYSFNRERRVRRPIAVVPRERYNGQQGDMWDARKDIAVALPEPEEMARISDEMRTVFDPLR